MNPIVSSSIYHPANLSISTLYKVIKNDNLYLFFLKWQVLDQPKSYLYLMGLQSTMIFTKNYAFMLMLLFAKVY